MHSLMAENIEINKGAPWERSASIAEYPICVIYRPYQW